VTVPDDIEQLREAEAELDDQLRVVEDGRVIVCVAMLATFYFLDGGSPEVRERVAQALDHYRAAIGPKLVWGAHNFARKPEPIRATETANPRAWMQRVAPNEAVDLMLHGGREPDDADPYRVIVVSRGGRPTRLSFFSFTVPLAWVAERPPGAFTKLVLEQSEILHPTHGYAGLAVTPYADVGRGDKALAATLPFIARFSGLEFDLPGSHAIYLEQENRIKGINWLTILDRRFIDELGGDAALEAALGAGVERHAFSSGVIIQAGPRPLFGDTHRQEPMPQYRQVAKALKPVRISSIRAIDTQHGFDRERSDAWLARFDD
jgi:hypothetical protein